MHWFGRRLIRKFTLATIAGFLVSSVVFLLLFLTFYRNELTQERAQASREVNRLLQTSLENAMLKRDLEGLMFIIRRLGQQPNIESVYITNPEGEIRFSSQPGRHLGERLEPAPRPLAGPQTLFLRDRKGHEVLRSINPVRNKPPCQACHGPIEKKPVNGILVVDYDAAAIRAKARRSTLVLMGAGALIVVINLVGGWWFIRRFILEPVARLSAASQALAAGELGSRVTMRGEDELAQLGSSFNTMAARIQQQVQELEENRAFLQALVDAIPDGVRIIDQDYRMILVNRAFREQTGCPEKEMEGDRCYRAAHGLEEPCPAELLTCPLQEIRREPRPLKLIHHHRNCRGERLDVEIFAAPMQVTRHGESQMLLVEAIRDLTSEVRFTHEQRLSELGRLAAGVAHEIYNPLSSMKLALASLDSEIRQLHADETVDQLLTAIEGEMAQCIEVTNRLLRLSAAPLEEPQLVELDQVVRDTLSLLQWEAAEQSVEVSSEFRHPPLRLLACEADMRMLVLNLVQNALHAMPRGGRLTVKGWREEGWILLQVADTGIGIPAQELQHIFMPFFSRRADGVPGTGLGLPIVKSIVEGAGGRIEVESEVGKGTVFTIRLPMGMEEVMS
jgi:PAS domain S-box-containing protein